MSKLETSLPAKSITAPIIMENMDLDKTDVEITLLSAWEEFGRHFVCTLVWGGWASQVPKYKEYKPWNQSFNYSTKWRIISTKIQLRAPASCHRLPSSLIEQEITLKNKIYKVFGKIVRIKNMFVKTHPITCFCDISEPKQKFSKVGLFLKWKTQPGKK